MTGDMSGGWSLEFKLCTKLYVDSPFERVRSYDVQKLIKFLK
jgi:hypothetical protein